MNFKEILEEEAWKDDPAVMEKHAKLCEKYGEFPLKRDPLPHRFKVLNAIEQAFETVFNKDPCSSEFPSNEVPSKQKEK